MIYFPCTLKINTRQKNCTAHLQIPYFNTLFEVTSIALRQKTHISDYMTYIYIHTHICAHTCTHIYRQILESIELYENEQMKNWLTYSCSFELYFGSLYCSVDPDQMVPYGTGWSGSILFADKRKIAAYNIRHFKINFFENSFSNTISVSNRLFVWFDSLCPINNLSVIKGLVFLGWTSTKLGLMCLAQGHNAVTPVRLEPANPLLRVKHSTTEPLRSLSNRLDPDQPDILSGLSGPNLFAKVMSRRH